MTPQTGELQAAFLGKLPDPLPARMGVAVSGGGDSVALLHLASRALAGTGCNLIAATVDHGLRPEAGAEAAQAATLAASLGIDHSILTWQGWDGQGNLQDQARRARYRLLTAWAAENDLSVLATGHTADDQAETVLMRLTRASGVSGLSGMAPARQLGSLTLLRPLLGIRRSTLRDYLRSENISWANDPSNDDLRFDRVKARQVLTALEPLGITAEVLTGVAQNMAQAREALGRYTHIAAQEMTETDFGDVIVNASAFAALPGEIRRRLLIGAAIWVSGAEYPPRRAAVDEAMTAILRGSGVTFGGCRALVGKASIRICREFNAVRDMAVAADAAWDGRWRFSGPDLQGAVIRALGENGLALCPEWREKGRPRAALLASPSVWFGENLISAPQAGFGTDWTLNLIRDQNAYFQALLSH